MQSPTQVPWLSAARRNWQLALLVIFGIHTVACSDAQTPPGGGGSAGLGGASSSLAGGQNFAGLSGAGTGGMSTASTGGGGAGAGGAAGLGGSAAGGGIDASFDTFKSLIPTHCFGGLCHDLPENPLQLTVNDQLYTTLTTHVTKHCGSLMVPGNPQDSALVKLLKGPCGDTNRMPFGKCFEDGDDGCVAPEYIAAIEQWIAKGAPQ